MATANQSPRESELTVTSGQLRSVMKEMHDRGLSEISLADLLERLEVGPLRRRASEYVDLPASVEGTTADILGLLRGTL